MKLKYTFRNTIWLIFKSYIILLLIVIAVIIWFDFEPFWIVGISILYLINILPGVYLHFEYLIANKNIEYLITSNQITMATNTGHKTYTTNELDKIIAYMSPSVFKKSEIRSWSMEDYYYARILTKGGEELIITCLLTLKLEEALLQLEGVEYIRRKEIFCTLSLKYRG